MTEGPRDGLQGDDIDFGVVTFEALGLGDRTYLAHDNEVAIVVDPQRDPSPYLESAAELGVTITDVLETHVHNDYVSGGLELARRVGARYVLPEGEPVEFEDECRHLGDGGMLEVGSLRVRAIGTPGHTAHHLAYLIESSTEGRGESTSVVCSGGSLLAGGSGRTDLFGKEATEPLARAQWMSVNRLLEILDERTVVLPTHGFGSFCSATPRLPAEEGALTIGLERGRNAANRLDAEQYVASVTTNLPPIPRYYRHMAKINRLGGRPFQLQPVKQVSVDSIEQEFVGVGYVVDLRERRAFARLHRRGVWNLELGPNLATYLGWVLPYFAPFAFVADDEGDVDQARALLARIGRETVAAWACSDELEAGGRKTASYPVATFADLAAICSSSEPPEIVDVRHLSEWRTAHLVDARHVPLSELERVRATLPDDQPIWVHCAAGFRAAVAASMLASAGRSPVLVDDVFANAIACGLAIESDNTFASTAVADAAN